MKELYTFMVSTNPNLLHALLIVWSIEAIAAMLNYILKHDGKFSCADAVRFIAAHLGNTLMIVLAAVIDHDIITVGSTMSTTTVYVCIGVAALNALHYIELIGGDVYPGIKRFFEELRVQLFNNQPSRSVIKTVHVPSGLNVYSAPTADAIVVGMVLTEGEKSIVEIAPGIGSTKGYGLLQTTGVWINLDHCTG